MSEAEFQIPGYAIQRRLGDGGMATVFLAIQKSLDRSVAIKVMRAHAGDESEEKRFMLEARTLARLPHPNIVSVYDIAQNESYNYIVMEFLRGGVLFYEMLARKLPFSGETTMALAYHHVNTAPPPLPLRFDFAQPLIDKMMAKNSKDRYPDLKTFARELRTILTGNQSLQQQVLQ